MVHGTRLTNAFSQKAENLAHTVSRHFMYHNFARIHRTLRVTLRWKLVFQIMFVLWKKLQLWQINLREALNHPRYL